MHLLVNSAHTTLMQTVQESYKTEKCVDILQELQVLSNMSNLTIAQQWAIDDAKQFLYVQDSKQRKDLNANQPFLICFY